MDEDEICWVPAVMVKRTYRDVPPADYTLKIEDFPLLLREMNKVMDNYQSGCFKAGGYRWRLSLYPFGDNRTTKETNYMSIYLVLTEKINSPIDVIIKFFVYDHARERYLMVEDANKQVKRFDKARSVHGISEFILVTSFSDTSNGYLQDDISCVFGVELYFIKNRVSKTIKVSDDSQPGVSDKDLLCQFAMKLIIYPRWENKWLALGLVLDGTNSANSRSNRNGDHKLYAKYTLVVKDQLNHRDIAREGSDYFSEVDTCRIKRKFLEVSKLHDQSKGFLANDVLIVQVRVNAISYEHNCQEV
ncbi:hypothetical protein AgCh_004116 [Apium graveolens]